MFQIFQSINLGDKGIQGTLKRKKENIVFTMVSDIYNINTVMLQLFMYLEILNQNHKINLVDTRNSAEQLSVKIVQLCCMLPVDTCMPNAIYLLRYQWE